MRSVSNGPAAELALDSMLLEVVIGALLAGDELIVMLDELTAKDELEDASLEMAELVVSDELLLLPATQAAKVVLAEAIIARRQNPLSNGFVGVLLLTVVVPS
ncbi:hypothetical protein MARGE09_P1527 [Marinagarivorans cellulosilyticus]|uniref:Uncharacterized protein n=1 Tax=Marinagarivorans cellulosilyticus TaxID=2721545 RepID=A0AAN1WGS9_9GAMM|nr:hypothetical protein MARGE09_P1527 [Marinagarivorans cellulosilyticus]